MPVGLTSSVRDHVGPVFLSLLRGRTSDMLSRLRIVMSMYSFHRTKCSKFIFLLVTAISLPGSARSSTYTQVDTRRPTGPQDCDPTVETLADDSLAYQWVVDHCEGTYVKQISETPFVVASFTRAIEDFRDLPPSHFLIQWPLVANDSVHLRAEGFDEGNPYRMDATQPVTSRSWTWNTDMLRDAGVFVGNLGFLATMNVRFSDSIATVVLPLRVTGENQPTLCGYQLTVIPPFEEVEQVSVSMARVDASGEIGTLAESQLNWTIFDEVIPVPARGFSTRGTYYVRVVALDPDGTPAHVEVLVHHDGGDESDCN